MAVSHSALTSLTSPSSNTSSFSCLILTLGYLSRTRYLGGRASPSLPEHINIPSGSRGTFYLTLNSPSLMNFNPSENNRAWSTLGLVHTCWPGSLPCSSMNRFLVWTESIGKPWQSRIHFRTLMPSVSPGLLLPLTYSKTVAQAPRSTYQPLYSQLSYQQGMFSFPLIILSSGHCTPRSLIRKEEKEEERKEEREGERGGERGT